MVATQADDPDARPRVDGWRMLAYKDRERIRLLSRWQQWISAPAPRR